MRFHDLPSFKRIAGLKLHPSVHAANFHADHLHVTIRGLEVTHAAGLLPPRVPDDSILQIIADDIEARTALDDDGCRVLRDLLVNAIDFGRDGNLIVGLSVFRGV